MGFRKEIREYAKSLAYSLDNGAMVHTCAPWNEWAQDWRSCNTIRGSMLLFKKFVLNKNIKVEVWGYYSHTSTDGLEGAEIEKADRKSMKKLFNFYFKK